MYRKFAGLLAVVVIVVVSVVLISMHFTPPLRESTVPVVIAKNITLVELVDRVNEFTLSLYGLVLRDHANTNTIISPFNVYIALTILYEGANTTTREELGRALGLNGADACLAYQQLLSILPISTNDNTTLYVANAAWFREKFPFREDYVSKVKECFSGEVKYFTTIDQLVEEVNEWVENKTNGLIKNMLSRNDAPSDTVAILVSAIYFKSLWLKEFEPYGEISFWTGNKWVNIKAMHVEKDSLRVVRSSDYIAVEIPYRDTNISMVIIMPSNFSRTIVEYRELVLGALEEIDKSKPVTSTHLVMPKFNVTFKSNLNDYLRELGIREVFTPGADLTRMAYVERGDIFVDRVIHQAVIRVNEKGTEAAAATAIIIRESLPSYLEEVVIDKPFIYLIRDRTSGVILFIGHVVDPSEAQD